MSNPVNKVIRSATITIAITYTTIEQLILSCVVGIEKNLLVTVVWTIVNIHKGFTKSVRTRILNCVNSCVISFLEIASSLRRIALALRIGWNILRILQPPSVCEISLCKHKSSCCLCYSTCKTWCCRKFLHCLFKIWEYSLLVNINNCVTYRTTKGRGIKFQLTSTQIQWYTTVCLNQLEIVESTEEMSLSEQSGINTCSLTIFNNTICCVNIWECTSPKNISTTVC